MHHYRTPASAIERKAYGSSVQQYDDAIDILHDWHHALGIHLTREHVEHAAHITGARFDLLWSIILTPATRTLSPERGY